MLNAELEEVRVTLPGRARNARRSWQERASIRLRVSDGQVVGWGEATPLPGYAEDTLDRARATLRALRWDVFEEAIDDMTALLEVVGHHVVGSAAARFAVETALLEIHGRRRGKTLAALLGEWLGREPEAIETAAWIDGPDAAATVEAGHRAVEAGHRTLKLKIGRDPRIELAIARTLRRSLGDGVQLRFDANGSLSMVTGLGFLDGLASVRPELVEEPVPWSELTAARGLVPVALDESLRSRGPAEVEPLLENGTLGALVLKPMALGLGICLAWAELAAHHDVPVVVSHLLGGGIEMNAAEALANALGGRLAHGLGHHMALDAFGVERRPARREVPEAVP